MGCPQPVPVLGHLHSNEILPPAQVELLCTSFSRGAWLHPLPQTLRGEVPSWSSHLEASAATDSAAGAGAPPAAGTAATRERAPGQPCASPAPAPRQPRASPAPAPRRSPLAGLEPPRLSRPRRSRPAPPPRAPRRCEGSALPLLGFPLGRPDLSIPTSPPAVPRPPPLLPPRRRCFKTPALLGMAWEIPRCRGKKCSRGPKGKSQV